MRYRGDGSGGKPILLNAVQRHQFPVQWNDWTRQGFEAQGPLLGGEIGRAMSIFARNPHDAAAAATLSESPEHVHQLRTTCVATRLAAGHADNALPQHATATINCRIFPGVSAQSIRDMLQRLAGGSAKVTLKDVTTESDASPMCADLMAAFAKAVHATHPGLPLVPHMEVGASEGSIFRAHGIPSYGVQGLFIRLRQDFTHGLNERMDVNALPYGLTHWYVLIKELSGQKH